jgi:hypothetical protein
MGEIEESVSGFKCRGGWVDVVEHGERIASALEELAGNHELNREALAEFDEWRPKSHERIEDVNEKTAEQAHLQEGKGEREGKDPDEDLQTAGEKLAESYGKLDDPEEAVDKWGESIDYVARAADSAGRKVIRRVEDSVYQKVMTRVSPYFFDNELVSANIRRVDHGDGPRFVFEINVNDDDLKILVSNRLADYEADLDRWHVNTEKTTETAELTEGVEAPNEDDGDEDLDAKTN